MWHKFRIFTYTGIVWEDANQVKFGGTIFTVSHLYIQAAWIVDGTDSENDNSDIESEEGNGMVLDEELENDDDPEKDEDATSRFTEKFDEEETGADTEMEVSLFFFSWKIVYRYHLIELMS